MQAGLPVLACTDLNTDVGKILVENNLGWWCESNDVAAFCQAVYDACEESVINQETVLQYLTDHYDVKNAAELILQK